MSDVKLFCFAESDEWFTKGKVYDVIEEIIDDEDDACYVVTDDLGNRHLFTKHPDVDGESFATWFEIIREDGDVSE